VVIVRGRVGFRHHWYIHRPYSPPLTRELFNPSEGKEKQPRNLYSVDALELIVSLAYLLKGGPEFGPDTKTKIFAYSFSTSSG
jgi:hypothetical protein